MCVRMRASVCKEQCRFSQFGTEVPGLILKLCPGQNDDELL